MCCALLFKTADQDSPVFYISAFNNYEDVLIWYCHTILRHHPSLSIILNLHQSSQVAVKHTFSDSQHLKSFQEFKL